MTILQVEHLSKDFGGLRAVDDLSFDLQKGEILGLIGPNGAGKSTVFEMISGFRPPTEGTISFNGENIVGLTPHLICHKGIGRTFQLVQTFPSLTTRETVMLAGLWRYSKDMAFQRAEKILDFVGLARKANLYPDKLTIAEQKSLEFARALAGETQVLLLDEIMAGLLPTETKIKMDLVRQVQDQGISIILVEHVMQAIMGLCSRIIVLNFGQKIAEGTPQEISSNNAVIEAYLGRGRKRA